MAILVLYSPSNLNKNNIFKYPLGFYINKRKKNSQGGIYNIYIYLFISLTDAGEATCQIKLT